METGDWLPTKPHVKWPTCEDVATNAITQLRCKHFRIDRRQQIHC